MNEDILKGKLHEAKGRIKEKWGKLTDDNLVEIEGKNEKLLGLLQKKYGFIKCKAGLEYKDSVELAEIISSIREIMKIKDDFTAIAFIARYGKPLFAKKPEILISGRESKPGCNTDLYSNSRFNRHTTHPNSPY